MQVWNKDKDPLHIIQSVSSLKVIEVVYDDDNFSTLSLHPVYTYLCVGAIYNYSIMQTTLKSVTSRPLKRPSYNKKREKITNTHRVKPYPNEQIMFTITKQNIWRWAGCLDK